MFRDLPHLRRAHSSSLLVALVACEQKVKASVFHFEVRMGSSTEFFLEKAANHLVLASQDLMRRTSEWCLIEFLSG